MQTEFRESPYNPDENFVNIAREAIESIGYPTETISLIPEGQAHYIYRITTQTGLTAIARFEKPGRGVGEDGIKRDFEFNGPVSISREKILIDLVRDLAGLPAPKIYAVFENAPIPFLLVEDMPGILWSEYLQSNNYSQESYLNSLKFIGTDLARAHAIQFNSFGDVLDRNSVNPGNITKFSERISMITEPKLQRAQKLGVYNTSEFDFLQTGFRSGLAELEDAERNSRIPSVLALTDLQPKNFLVDINGKPSGYVDLEYCQAAPASVDFYFLRWFLLNYFENTSDQAEEVFFEGYRENGGVYDPEDPVNRRIEHLLSVNRLLQAINEYHKLTDEMRATWSEQFKELLFDGLSNKSFHYPAIIAVFRTWSGQPRFAN